MTMHDEGYVDMRCYLTPGAQAVLERFPVAVEAMLARHLAGDWGDVDEEDWRSNDLAAEHGGRVLSTYTLYTGQRVWVITEADRTVTTILLPEELAKQTDVGRFLVSTAFIDSKWQEPFYESMVFPLDNGKVDFCEVHCFRTWDASRIGQQHAAAIAWAGRHQWP